MAFESAIIELEAELGIAVPVPIRAVLAERFPVPTRDQLIQHLTNGQTYFFRHPDQCDAFFEHLKQCDPLTHLKIWSAGCSTGCEAYTIAILLDRARRAGTVLGSDISLDRVAQARQGIYPESRLTRLSPADKRKYFSPEEGDLWRVRSILQAMVSFELESLNQNSGPGMSQFWDVIFCRNVLIYFDEAKAREILNSLVSRLRLGGLLVLGFPEAFFGLQHPDLSLLTSRSAIFERRSPIDVNDVVAPTTATVAPRLTWASPGAFQDGLRAHAAGQLEQARKLFQEAEKENPDFPLIHYFSARLFDELRQTLLAKASLNKYFATFSESDPAVLAFTERNGISIAQLNLAAQRLHERLSRSES